MEYTLHGLSISDPWFWLEDLDSAETRAWVETQNQRTFAFLEAIPQREEIRKRMTELWNYSRRRCRSEGRGTLIFAMTDTRTSGYFRSRRDLMAPSEFFSIPTRFHPTEQVHSWN
jgi:prolyl oligopeptidase